MIDLDFPSFWETLDQPNPPFSLPEWMEDHQTRSRVTRQHILRTVATMMHTQSLEDITMQAIADESDVSIGAMYARFPSKTAVLALLGAVCLDGSRKRFEKALASRKAGTGLRAVFNAYLTTLVGEMTRQRLVILELHRHTGIAQEVRELVTWIHLQGHSTFLRHAREHAADIRHRDKDAALRFALFLVNAGAREAILANVLPVYTLKHSQRNLATELTRVATAYLEGEANRS